MYTDAQQNIEALRKIIENALIQGKRKNEIIKILINLDWKREVATAYIAEVANSIMPSIRHARSEKGLRFMMWGIVSLIIGSGVTLMTYQNASEYGGTFIIAYGAIIGGLTGFVLGLVGWLKNRSRSFKSNFPDTHYATPPHIPENPYLTWECPQCKQKNPNTTFKCNACQYSL